MTDVGFTIGGDNSEFLAAIKESQAAVSQAAAAIRESLKDVSGNFRKVTEDVEGVGEALKSVQGSVREAFEFVGIAAAAEVFNKIGESIESMAAHVRQISTDSQLLGVTVEQFQAIEHAGEEAGVGTEVLTRAGERLIVTLTEARNGSSSAIDKLLTLGITAGQIRDPLFGVNDMFAILRERLENAGTAQQTMNALLATLGNRAASAAVALKDYDGSADGVKKTMQDLNGLNADQIEQLKQLGSFWGNLGTLVSNTASKMRLVVGNMAKGPGVDTLMDDSIASQQSAADNSSSTAGSGPSVEAAQSASKTREQIAQEEENNWSVIQQTMLQQELQNIQYGVGAFKQGTAQRLAALQEYARVAAQLYGQEAPITRQASEKALEEQRAFNQQQKQGIQELVDFGKELDNELMVAHARIKLEMARADAAYVEANKKYQQELNELTETGIELNNSVVKLQAENAKRVEQYNKQVRSDFERQYKGIADSITNSVSGALTNMITHTKSFQQEMASIFQSLVGAIIKHFVEMGVQWVETQLMNLIVGQTTAKAQGEALAGQAGAAGVASFAGAPWPLDLGAPAFGAAMFAEAQSFAVAERGYDVPAGINPMTQLHAKEMVLPANLADTVRGMAAGGGSGREEHHTYNGDVNISHADLGRMIGNRTAQRQLTREIAKGYRRGVRP